MSSTVQAAIATSNALHDIESGHLPTALTGGDNNNDKGSRFDVVTLLTLALGFGSVVLNLLAMIFSSETVPVLAMGVVALLVAPVIMYRQVGMDKGAMRNLQNLLRENVISLSLENVRLCKQINEFGAKVQRYRIFDIEGMSHLSMYCILSPCANHTMSVTYVCSLKKYEDELATLAKDSKQDVDTLVELVKENGKIMAALKVRVGCGTY